MNPGDRLRAAADRLEELDKAASGSPWKVIESHGRDYSGEGYSFVTLVMRETDDDVARWYGETDRETSDARLIAALRPLALPIAAWLLTEADRWERETSRPGGVLIHFLENSPVGCGAPVEPQNGYSCNCFTRALSVADAVLAATGGAA